MKQYTVAIVGALKKKGLFSLSRKFDSRFYQAKHNQLPITVMWIETNALGKPLCYPCVIQEGEEIMAFRTAMRAQNKALLQRWGQVISPGNKEEFLIEEMEEEAFRDQYDQAKYEVDKREGMLLPGEEEWTDEELLADEELAALDEEEGEEMPEDTPSDHRPYRTQRRKSADTGAKQKSIEGRTWLGTAMSGLFCCGKKGAIGQMDGAAEQNHTRWQREDCTANRSGQHRENSIY